MGSDTDDGSSAQIRGFHNDSRTLKVMPVQRVVHAPSSLSMAASRHASTTLVAPASCAALVGPAPLVGIPVGDFCACGKHERCASGRPGGVGAGRWQAHLVSGLADQLHPSPHQAPSPWFETAWLRLSQHCLQCALSEPVHLAVILLQRRSNPGRTTRTLDSWSSCTDGTFQRAGYSTAARGGTASGHAPSRSAPLTWHRDAALLADPSREAAAAGTRLLGLLGSLGLLRQGEGGEGAGDA